jgi:hypothetical protein
VIVSIGEVKNVALIPSPRLGSGSVFVEPAEASDAEIYVDNVAKRNAPLVLPLLIGNYSITYEGTRQQSIDRWATGKWLGVVGTVVASGVAGYFFLSADKNLDYYKNASTTSDIAHFKNLSEKHNQYVTISVGVAGGFLAGTIYSWIMEKSY